MRGVGGSKWKEQNDRTILIKKRVIKFRYLNKNKISLRNETAEQACLQQYCDSEKLRVSASPPETLRRLQALRVKWDTSQQIMEPTCMVPFLLNCTAAPPAFYPCTEQVTAASASLCSWDKHTREVVLKI